jgi:hypothetical protein
VSRMNNDYIFELIQNGQECEYLDFKATEYNKEREGKKEIAGLDKIKDSSSYQQLIHSNIEPYFTII